MTAWRGLNAKKAGSLKVLISKWRIHFTSHNFLAFEDYFKIFYKFCFLNSLNLKVIEISKQTILSSILQKIKSFVLHYTHINTKDKEIFQDLQTSLTLKIFEVIFSFSFNCVFQWACIPTQSFVKSHIKAGKAKIILYFYFLRNKRNSKSKRWNNINFLIFLLLHDDKY